MKRKVTWFAREIELAFEGPEKDETLNRYTGECGALHVSWLGCWRASAYGCGGDGLTLQGAVRALEAKLLRVHTGCFTEIAASLDAERS